jgi:hypothetical protein
VADAQMDPQQSTARAWLDTSHLSGNGPVDLIDRLSTILNDPERVGLATGIVDAIAFSIANATEPTEHFDRHDRLPLTRAKREAVAWENEPADQFARHVLEAWVLAQHVYWSVGRGLADARARGRQILRLKVVLDEGGWTLAPGVSSIFTPRPTPDRLETALSLAGECGLH